MNISIEFCEARALQAGEDARSASLENVRKRALRSKAAWEAMASRATAIAKAKAHKMLESPQALDRAEAETDQLENDDGPQ